MTASGYDSPTDVPGSEDLKELALDMRWSWNHAADELWNQIEPELWELTRSPWVVLQTAAATKLEEVCRDPIFSEKARGLIRRQRESLQRETSGYSVIERLTATLPIGTFGVQFEGAPRTGTRVAQCLPMRRGTRRALRGPNASCRMRSALNEALRR